MGFTTMKEEDLRKVAVEDFGVEVPEGANVQEIAAALIENGVTWEDAVKHSETAASYEVEKAQETPEAEVERAAVERSQPRNKPVTAPEVEVAPDALLRMMRENRRYDVRGYTFTHDNPFGLVDPKNAEWIVENVDGFRYATPKEVREYYN